MYREPAYNSFSMMQVDDLKEKTGLDYYKKVEISCQRLDKILKKYNVQKLELLDIDAEGFDFKILKSNDWTNIRPKIILMEIYEKEIQTILASEIFKFLQKQDYKFFSKSFNTVLFISTEFYQERVNR